MQKRGNNSPFTFNPNPKPQTPNPKPQTPNPIIKFQTSNPESKTLNPQARTQTSGWRKRSSFGRLLPSTTLSLRFYLLPWHPLALGEWNRIVNLPHFSRWVDKGGIGLGMQQDGEVGSFGDSRGNRLESCPIRFLPCQPPVGSGRSQGLKTICTGSPYKLHRGVLLLYRGFLVFYRTKQIY